MKRHILLSAGAAAVLGLAAISAPSASASSTAEAHDRNSQPHASGSAGAAAGGHVPAAAANRKPTLPPPGPYRATATPTKAPTGAKAAAVAAATLKGLSPGTRNLVRDYEKGTISRADFVRYASGRLDQSFPIPAPYQAATASAEELTTLALLSREEGEKLPPATQGSLKKEAAANKARSTSNARAAYERQHGPSLSATATSSPSVTSLATAATNACTNWTTWPYTCRMDTAHTQLLWSASGLQALPANQLVDKDGNGLPDLPESVSKTLEQSWQTYSAMGMTAPAGTIVTVLNPPFVNNGVSLPASFVGENQIRLPGWTDGDYRPAHEMFHQFQYPYLEQATFSGLAAELAAVGDSNWWMEATAEWGAQTYLDSHPSADPTPYAAGNVYRFLETTEQALSYSDGLAGSRHYGTMVAVNWFVQRFGQDFVRHSWEQFANDTWVDSKSDVADTIASYGEQGAELGNLWDAANMLCDPAPQYWWSTDRLRRADVPTWCSKWLNVDPKLAVNYGAGTFARPARHTADLLTSSSMDLTVDAGGAGYIDLTKPASEVSREVTFTPSVVRPDGSAAILMVRTWGSAWYPQVGASPSQYCDSRRIPVDGTATVTVTLDPYCPYVTATLVNARITGPSESLHLVWTSRLTSAAISNGVIRLGVNDSGNLDVDDPTRSVTGYYGLGMRYLPTNADAFAPGCWCEGWGLSGPNSDGTGTDHGSANEDYGGLRGGRVLDFHTTASEAWSTVQVGAYVVKHHYHPSTDPRVYQVDIYVSTPGANLLAPPVTYRRVLDFDIEPTAFREYMSIHKDAADTAIVDATNDGFADPDPTTPLTDLGYRGSFTDVGPSDQGAAFDLHANVNSLTSQPSLTLFYGAGSSTDDATSALAAVGATSWAMAKPSSSDPVQGTPNAFVFGYKRS